MVLLSHLASWQALRHLNPTSPEQRLAWEISSVVNLTRSALISTEGERRLALLDELAREEGVRIALLEAGDRTTPLPGPGDAKLLEKRLRSLLGPETRIAGRLNGSSGLWISFHIDADQYWLGLRLERWTRQAGPPWWVLIALALLVSAGAGLLISRVINRPLARLASALGRVSSSATPALLPETGPTEIAELNRHFNAMSHELAELENDRAITLAGISHDIRTPLTRLRMEVEMAAIAEADRESMVSDIERIDLIVGKFVEYARSGSTTHEEQIGCIDVAALLQALRDNYAPRIQAGQLSIDLDVQDSLEWRGDSLDLARAMANLIENALRYGHREGEPTRLRIRARRLSMDVRGHATLALDMDPARFSGPWRATGIPEGLLIETSDDGPGVPEEAIERLLRPFTRLAHERNELGASGLGLAIVQRIALRYRGSCSLANQTGGGLLVKLVLPDVAR